MSVKPNLKPKTEKEIRKILNRLNPDLKRLLEIVETIEADSVVGETIQNGARTLRVARRILKK